VDAFTDHGDSIQAPSIRPTGAYRLDSPRHDGPAGPSGDASRMLSGVRMAMVGLAIATIVAALFTTTRGG
jgi:hypothetical protein